MSDATPGGAHHLVLGPSRAELWHTFRLPVGAFALGCGLVAVGLGSPPRGLSVGAIFGGVVVALALALGLMEWADIRRPWVAWDGSRLTWGDRDDALAVPLALVASLRLVEVTTARPRRRGERRLWLELRPLDWADFTKSQPNAERWANAALADFTIGLRASMGDRHAAQVDRQLASLSCYTGRAALSQALAARPTPFSRK
jgi:hypothetical protein